MVYTNLNGFSRKAALLQDRNIFK